MITENEKKVLARASRILEREMRSSDDVLSSPSLVHDYFKTKIGHLEFESFYLLVLTNRHTVIDLIEVSRGTLDQAAVYPRECIKAVLALNGAACIAAHNHPSLQTSEPSDTDVRLTRKLGDAFALLDIRLLDHVVVSGSHFTSLAERGLM